MFSLYHARVAHPTETVIGTRVCEETWGQAVWCREDVFPHGGVPPCDARLNLTCRDAQELIHQALTDAQERYRVSDGPLELVVKACKYSHGVARIRCRALNAVLYMSGGQGDSSTTMVSSKVSTSRHVHGY